MADAFTRKKRSEIMGKIRGSNTLMEQTFRKALWSHGIRYRKNSRNHFGKPDVVISKAKIVVFLDSCFWHGCPKHFIMPKSNLSYWKAKAQRNKKRDKEVMAYYKKAGWRCLRLWSHELKKADDVEKAIIKLTRTMK
ncbi:MAG: very short patch repair endonuclease [Candidatus Andersenbacteria bacterium]